ncbi:hypothetical protein BJH93_00800 [Kocuria polaris]|nr:hypothetical protein [Kocuria polaris]
MKFDIHHDAAEQTTRAAELALSQVRNDLTAIHAEDRSLRAGLPESGVVQAALEEFSNYVVAPTEENLQQNIDSAIHWTRLALHIYAAGDQDMAGAANRAGEQAHSPAVPEAPQW